MIACYKNEINVKGVQEEKVNWFQIRGSYGFPCLSVSKESACNAGDLGWIPGSGRSLGEENGTPLQSSCLENPMDRGAQWAIVHGVARVSYYFSE